MSYEIKGKIISVLDMRNGTAKSTGNNWVAQSYVLETDERYPKRVCFDIFGEEKIKDSAIQLHETVTISVDIDAREYNGRWYNSVRLLSVKRDGVPTIPNEPKDLPADFYNSDDEPPF